MKQMNTIEDLAIFGGEPAFAEQLHVGRPNVGKRRNFLERIDKMFDSMRFTNNGPYVKEFEQKIAELVDVKHCIATCNGTAALEIAIKAAQLTGEVIIPSFTFVATAHSLMWSGIVPVFCDIDPETHNMDPKIVERLISPRTTGLMPVHLWGRPCNADELTSLADRHGLTLLFDSAHAFGCSHNAKMIGGFGKAEVFSFHATKFIHSFEGGALVTDDDEIAQKARLYRNFGFSGIDSVESVGINAKMNEPCAAMGLSCIESMDEIIETNRKNYITYRDNLDGMPGLRLMTYNERERCNYQYIVIEIEDAIAQIKRDSLVSIIQAENVLARRYFYPGCHLSEPYRSRFPDAGQSLKETEGLAQRVIVLPTGTSVTTGDIKKVCGLISFIIQNAGKVNELMANS